MRYVFQNTGSIKARMDKSEEVVGFVEADGRIILSIDWECRRFSVKRSLYRAIKSELESRKPVPERLLKAAQRLEEL